MKYCKLIYVCKARAGAAENGDEPVKKEPNEVRKTLAELRGEI